MNATDTGTPSGEAPILVPVDFSPHSEAALVWAARLARSFEAPLLVLHVVHDPEAAPGYYGRSGSNPLAGRMEEAAGEMLENFLRRLREQHPELGQQVEVKTKLVVGLPVQRILEVAERTRACMIAMGSRGRTGIPHLLLGSKAERVVQLAPIPVTIVKAVREDAAADG